MNVEHIPLSTPLETNPITQTLLPNATTKRKCPIFCEENPDGKWYNLNVIADVGDEKRVPKDVFNEKLCKLTGTKNIELAEAIVADAAYAVCGLSKIWDKRNIILQSLSEQEPKDINEARLCAQAASLYSAGMDYLFRATAVLTSETIAKQEWHTIFMKAATKLLDLHSRTVAELARYRQNGEQRIVVQHVQVNEGGQAIVGGVLSGGRG